jgi:hypothetical protein
VRSPSRTSSPEVTYSAESGNDRRSSQQGRQDTPTKRHPRRRPVVPPSSGQSTTPAERVPTDRWLEHQAAVMRSLIQTR